MSAIRTRHDKTTRLLVTKGDNGHFRTLRAITYKKILNKSNVILAACLHLLATFGLECRPFACKKIPSAKKWGGGGLPVHRLCQMVACLLTSLVCIAFPCALKCKQILTASKLVARSSTSTTASPQQISHLLLA